MEEELVGIQRYNSTLPIIALIQPEGRLRIGYCRWTGRMRRGGIATPCERRRRMAAGTGRSKGIDEGGGRRSKTSVVMGGEGSGGAKRGRR